jgi:hypothetical protein
MWVAAQGAAITGGYRGPGLPYEKDQAASYAIDYSLTLGWLKKRAANLEKSHGARLPELLQPLRQIQSDTAFLQQKWLAWPQRHPGQNPYSGNIKLDQYYRALVGSENRLKELSKAGDEEVLQTVKAVADDLHAKAENCRYSADGLGKNIKVTVHTKKGTAEVAGYEVFCAPMALLKFQNEHIRFPRISSPTVYQNFAPGRYGMWLQRENEKTQPVAQTIGGRGEKEVEIDLPIPTESAPAP